MKVPIFLDFEGVITHNGQFIHTVIVNLVKDKLNYDQINERYSKARLGEISFEEFQEGFPKGTIKKAIKEVVFHKGTKEFLEWSKGKNNLYVASNNIPTFCDLQVKHLDVNKYFKKIFFSCYIKKKKPDEDFYKYILNISKEKPGIFVDDAKRNLMAAKNMGFTTVWVDNTKTNLNEDKRNLLDYTPDYTITDLKELIKIVEKINYNNKH